jgi:beta-xylosidase
MRRIAAVLRRPILGAVVTLAAAGCGRSEPGGSSVVGPDPREGSGRNPIVRSRFSSDPAALVHDGRVWLYTGHDEAPSGADQFVMRDWRLYSSDDLVHWEEHGSPISVGTFRWAVGDAWASQAIERDGRVYFYATVRAEDGFAVGVAVAETPEGPFEDARGAPLIANPMTEGPYVNGRRMDWDDIDPTVFVDDDGQAYLFWGNTVLHYAKLTQDMVALDGPIEELTVPHFTEAPWIHRYGGRYYLSYAYGYPEQIAYATADRITGPYTFQGIVNPTVPGSPTNHQAIVTFDGAWYFFYHDARLPGGGAFRRSVSVERMFYDDAGRIFPILQAEYGLDADPPAGAVDSGG